MTNEIRTYPCTGRDCPYVTGTGRGDEVRCDIWPFPILIKFPEEWRVLGGQECPFDDSCNQVARIFKENCPF